MLRTRWLVIPLLAALMLGMTAVPSQAGVVGGPPPPTYHNTTTMHLPPSLNQYTSFDIAFVDSSTHTLATTDRSNRSVDIWDTTTEQFVLSSQPVFAGIHSPSSLGGPNGVYIVPSGSFGETQSRGYSWAGDGDSTVKVINNNTGQEFGAPIPTGGNTRADELWYGPQQREIMIGVPDQGTITPVPYGEPAYPFEAFISTTGTPGPTSLQAQLIYDGTGNPCGAGTVGAVPITVCHTPYGDVATNGLEQPIYVGGFFYLAVPGNPAGTGRVDKINPVSYQVVAEIPMPNCGTGPTGLSDISPTEAVAACSTNTGGLGYVDLKNLKEDGSPIPETSGADQIWYDPFSGNTYAPDRTAEPKGCAQSGITVDLAAPSGPQGPFTGVCVAVVQGGNAASATVLAEVQLPVGAASHSVSVDSTNGRVFVPAADLDCTTGTCPPTSSVTPCPVSLEQGGCLHDQGVAVIELAP